MSKKIIIGITGASGSIYAQQIVKDILENSAYHISVIYSENGKKVWNYELNTPLIQENERIKLFDNNEMFSSPASGSSMYDTMIVAPCSMGTLAQIANGGSYNLIGRSADVILKERKKLILLVREAPYNLIHLHNMEKITSMGGIIVPASPSFYSKPKNIYELIKTITDRILIMLDVSIEINKWGI